MTPSPGPEGEQRLKRPLLLHPFLFAFIPILFLYSHNIGELSLSELGVPVVAAASASLVLWFALRLILRDPVPAGVVASVWWLWFFSFGHLHNLVPRPSAPTFAIPTTVIFTIAYTVLLVVGLALIVERRGQLQTLSSALNIMAVALVAWQVLTIGTFEVRHAAADRRKPQASLRAAPEAVRPRVAPDIYFIVLDAYARADVLKDLYHYDDRPFLDHLRQKGFHVARKAKANYCQTLLSLAATLNLEYLDALPAQVGRDSDDRRPLLRMIKDSRLFRFFRKQGYRIVAFASGYGPTEMTDADVYINLSSGAAAFRGSVLDATPIPLILAAARAGRPQPDPRAQPILYAFDHLADATRLRPPVFVFAHITTPHLPPLLFDRYGPVSTGPWRSGLFDHPTAPIGGSEYAAHYREQLMFATRKAQAAVDAILAQAERPTAIIILSDHGPQMKLDWQNAQGTDLRERFGILLACYLPGGRDIPFDDNTSAVNVFRLVLNRYFGTDFDLSRNECYFSSWFHPYRFVRVTDAVDGSAAAR